MRCVDRDNRIHGRPDNAGQPFLALAQGRLNPLPLGDLCLRQLVEPDVVERDRSAAGQLFSQRQIVGAVAPTRRARCEGDRAERAPVQHQGHADIGCETQPTQGLEVFGIASGRQQQRVGRLWAQLRLASLDHLRHEVLRLWVERVALGARARQRGPGLVDVRQRQPVDRIIRFEHMDRTPVSEIGDSELRHAIECGHIVERGGQQDARRGQESLGHIRALALDCIADGARQPTAGDLPFDQIILCAGLHGVQSKRLVGQIGQDDDWRPGRVLLQLHQRRQALAVVQAQVEQDHIKLRLAQLLEGEGQPLDIGDCERGGRQRRERLVDQQHIGRVVFDQQCAKTLIAHCIHLQTWRPFKQGLSNVIVSPGLVVRDGKHLHGGRVLLVGGVAQREAEVINIIAQRLGPLGIIQAIPRTNVLTLVSATTPSRSMSAVHFREPL